MTFTPNPVGFDVGAVGDLNNDGALDVMNSGTARINDGNNNNWLRIQTVGTVSNSEGMGARITITTASGQQIREVRSGDGFRYMSTITAHFGLGQDDVVEQVQICWPSGVVSVLNDVPVNGTITVVEEISTDVREQVATDLLLYPMPANDLLVVSGTGLANSAVRVFNAAGAQVLSGSLQNDRLNVSGLTPGLYLLEVTSPSGAVRKPFVKD
jgi:hypothetical protein